MIVDSVSGELRPVDASRIPKRTLGQLAGATVSAVGEMANDGKFVMTRLERWTPLPPPADKPRPGLGGGILAFNGVISDAACGAKHREGNEADRRCVAACLKGRGGPAVLVTADGKVLKIMDGSALSADFAGQRVSLRGKVDGDSIQIIGKVSLR